MPHEGDDKSALLLAVGELLHQEIAIDDLLQRLVRRICVELDADRGTIYLLDRGKGELFSKAARLPEIDGIRLRLGQGVAGHVAETGRAMNVPEVKRDDRFYGGVDEETGYLTESMLAVPMRDQGGHTIGVVQLLNKRGGPFDLDDERRLGALAEQAALAIAATTLYEDLGRAPASTLTPLPLEGQFNLIVGGSEALRRACRLTHRAASSEATVLLRGESGTGKELFARALHINSARCDGPLVKVDCAALPETLIDNELFGHEKGAFTGADQRRPGKLHAARGGTLFLDELGELPLAVQGKLLRVLQDQEYLPVGGNEPVKTDVRVVAATNRNLERMVKEGLFREDLYYRVKVVEIVLPPLRERGPGDVDRLALHFVHAAAKRHGRAVVELSEGARERLRAYPWPGNVRELSNCIESALVVTDGSRIEADDLPLPDRPLLVGSAWPAESQRGSAPSARTAPASAPPLTLAEVERRHIEAVLKRVDGNRTQAAALLGIGRNTLTRKLKRFGDDS